MVVQVTFADKKIAQARVTRLLEEPPLDTRGIPYTIIEKETEMLFTRKGLAVTALILWAGTAFATQQGTLYKSPTCGCCGKYVDYLRARGLKVTAVDSTDMDATKKQMGVPFGLASCHTMVIGKYIVEGHVPVAAIQKLLREQPNIVGISAPGMPANSPGMGPMQKGTLKVYSIGHDGGAAKIFSIE